MEKNKIHNILIVCTGNSCRSIMAEGYLKKRIKEEDLDLKVRSAGTGAIDGTKPPQETIEMLRTENIDPAGLEAAMITKELVDWADAILVMEAAHKSTIAQAWPESEEKVYLLGKYNSSEFDDVPDPIGRSLDFYRETFDLIKESIEEFIKWLKG